MKKMNFDIAVIGGGPAGLAAAVKARKEAEQEYYGEYLEAETV